MKYTSKIKSAVYARSAAVNESEIVRQINASVEATSRNGESVVGIYAESGHSGMTLKRPELQRLLNDAKKGKFSKLYLRDIERISRDVRKMYAACDQLKRSGITIVTEAAPRGAAWRELFGLI